MKTMKKQSIIALVLLLLLGSCNIPLCDIAQEQGAEGVEEIRLFHGDTMSWVRTGNPDVRRLCPGRFFHYHIGEDSICTYFIMESGAGYGTIISGHIAESVMDSTFLLADRKALDSIFGPSQTLPCPFDSSMTYRGRPKLPHTTLDDYYDVINKSPYHDYWILNLKTSDVYGPLKYEAYLAKKKELGVSSELHLKCEK